MLDYKVAPGLTAAQLRETTLLISPNRAYREAAWRAVAASIATIDRFSDVRVKRGGNDGEWQEFEGGADALDLPSVAFGSLTFKEVVGEFLYFYYIAGVRSNLGATSKDLGKYGEKYEELLGSAVAERLRNMAEEKKAVLDKIETAKTAGTAPWADDEYRKKAIKWIETEYETKNRFYRAVEAIDLYLKAFSAAISAEPDSVREMKKMIDSTQILGRWFDSKSGEGLWKAFEGMKGIVSNVAAANVIPKTPTPPRLIPFDFMLRPFPLKINIS